MPGGSVLLREAVSLSCNGYAFHPYEFFPKTTVVPLLVSAGYLIISGENSLCTLMLLSFRIAIEYYLFKLLKKSEGNSDTCILISRTLINCLVVALVWHQAGIEGSVWSLSLGLMYTPTALLESSSEYLFISHACVIVTDCLSMFGVGYDPYRALRIAVAESLAAWGFLLLRYKYDRTVGILQGSSHIVASIQEPLFTLDSELQITAVNAAICKLLGFEAAELQGNFVRKIILQEHYDQVVKAIADSNSELRKLSAGAEVSHTRHATHTFFQSKAGDMIPVSLYISSLKKSCSSRGNRQQDCGYVCLAHDLTDVEKLRKLEESKVAAEAEARLREQLLTTLSHEIRNPLSGIINLSGLLSDEELNEDQRDMVDSIRTSGELLIAILNDVLDSSKLEAGMLKLEETDFDLAECVYGVSDFTALSAFKKGLDVIVEVYPDVPRFLHADSIRFSQILINLLNNAIRFTHEGSVTLRVQQDSSISESSEGKVILLVEVRDTGIGISEEEQRALFTPFAQIHRSRDYGGSGLGLNICKKLVDLMGGAISLHSEVGVGSTFSISIPFSVAEAPDMPEIAEIPTPQISGANLAPTTTVIEPAEMRRRRSAAGKTVSTPIPLSATSSTILASTTSSSSSSSSSYLPSSSSSPKDRSVPRAELKPSVNFGRRILLRSTPFTSSFNSFHFHTVALSTNLTPTEHEEIVSVYFAIHLPILVYIKHKALVQSMRDYLKLCNLPLEIIEGPSDLSTLGQQDAFVTIIDSELCSGEQQCFDSLLTYLRGNPRQHTVLLYNILQKEMGRSLLSEGLWMSVRKPFKWKHLRSILLSAAEQHKRILSMEGEGGRRSAPALKIMPTQDQAEEGVCSSKMLMRRASSPAALQRPTSVETHQPIQDPRFHFQSRSTGIHTAAALQTPLIYRHIGEGRETESAPTISKPNVQITQRPDGSSITTVQIKTNAPTASSSSLPSSSSALSASSSSSSGSSSSSSSFASSTPTSQVCVTTLPEREGDLPPSTVCVTTSATPQGGRVQSVSVTAAATTGGGSAYPSDMRRSSVSSSHSTDEAGMGVPGFLPSPSPVSERETQIQDVAASVKARADVNTGTIQAVASLRRGSVQQRTSPTFSERDRGSGVISRSTHTERRSSVPGICHDFYVLAAEDCEVSACVLTRTLKKLGATVKIENNGKSLIERFLQEFKQVDLIITDCHMPLMSGFELTRVIRNVETALSTPRTGRPRIPIIALTGETSEEMKKSCLEAGMDEVLSKPLNIEELKRAIQKYAALSGKQLRQSLHAGGSVSVEEKDVTTAKTTVTSP